MNLYSAQCYTLHWTDNNILLSRLKMNNNRRTDLPEHRQKNDTLCQELQIVAERWRLHAGIRPTFPTYDVTCQLTYFRRVEGLPVFEVEENWRVRFWHCHTASGAFHYLSEHKTYEWEAQKTQCWVSSFITIAGKKQIIHLLVKYTRLMSQEKDQDHKLEMMIDTKADDNNTFKWMHRQQWYF